MIFKRVQKIIKRYSKKLDLSREIQYRILHHSLEKKAFCSTEMGINQNQTRDNKIILSLTTFNKRIHDVHIVIESLLRQTVKADKIILWLAEDEFTLDNIPVILKNQKKRGLEIYFCNDIRSYKKIIPTLKEYPEEIIITVDDDTIYPNDLIERLFKTYIQNEGEYVIFYRGHRIIFDSKGKTLPYDSWKNAGNDWIPSHQFLPTGVGGVLYPPNCFDIEVLNESKFMELAPFADDIWLRAMTLKNNIKCVKVNDERNWGKRIHTIKSGQDIALSVMNNGKKQNDQQFKNVFGYYKLWDRIQGDKK